MAVLSIAVGSLRAQDSASAGAELQRQVAILNGAGDEQAREQAARRLVALNTPESLESLRQVLLDPADRNGHMLVSRALTADGGDGRQFIDPLATLIGNDPALAEVVGMTLASYAARGSFTAWEKLDAQSRVQTRTPAARVAIIRAMGRLVDKQAAQSLVQTLSDSNNDIRIRNAAADALGETTGISRHGRDFALWGRWWTENARTDAVSFRQEQLARRAILSSEETKRRRVLAEAVRSLLRDDYLKTPAGLAAETKLKAYLGSDAEDIRLVGVDLVADDFAGGRPPTAAVSTRLRQMVGDASTDVRRSVARTLGLLNDPAALDPLLAQLQVEDDTDVRAAIAAALGPIHDLRAIDPLLVCLLDSSQGVSEAAAMAVKELGAEIRKANDRVMSRKIAATLRSRLSDAPRGSPLRDRLAEAMAKLGDESLLNDFYNLLRREESAPVLRAALAGLSEIGIKDSADRIIQWIDHGEQGVRLEAVLALGKTGSFPYVDPLCKRLNVAIEPDDSVRMALWSVIQSLAETGTVKDLDRLAERFRTEPGIASPERRRTILEKEEKKLIAEKSEDELAAVRVSIAETLMQMDPPEAERAAARYRLSLDYYNTHNKPESLTDPLIGKLMQALLRANQYADAMKFASESIARKRADTTTMGTAIRDEVERLRAARKYDAALQVIDAAEKIGESLGMYHAQLLILKDQIIKTRDSGSWFLQSLEETYAGPPFVPVLDELQLLG